MSTTLREKVRAGITAEESCVILWRLMELADQNRDLGGPDEIVLEPDNTVKVVYPAQGRNLALCAPEVIRAHLNDRAIGTTKAQGWFTMGMLAFFMFNGEEYYIKNQVGLLDLIRRPPQRTGVIGENEAGRVPFAKAVSQLTAFDPEERVKGLTEFMRYVSVQMPAKAEIRYLCNRSVVGRDTRTLDTDIENLIPDGKIRLSGTTYAPVTSPVRIPYLPGTHEYDVKLKKVDEPAVTGRHLAISMFLFTGAEADRENMVKFLLLNRDDSANQIRLRMNQPECRLQLVETMANGQSHVRRTITVPKPAAYTQDYLVNARYEAAEGNVYIRVMSLDKRSLANMQTLKLGKLS